MNIDYELIPFELVAKLIKQKKLRLIDDMNLNAGYKANLYGGAFTCIEINQTVFKFPTPSETIRFFAGNRKVPPGFAKFKMVIDVAKTQARPDLQYQLISYDFFNHCRLASNTLKVLSEMILEDGRIAVLYARTNLEVGQRTQEFFLVVGRMVFKNRNIEPLISLYFAIQDGSAIYWRPELAGTINHTPQYNIMPYNRRQETIVGNSQFRQAIHFTNGLIAEVFQFKSISARIYVRIFDWFYSFINLADCDFIFNKIQGSTLPGKSADKEAMTLHIELISKGLDRYISSDLRYWTFHPKFFIDETGLFTGLNTMPRFPVQTVPAGSLVFS